jgi:hypothetical protein
MKKHYVTFYSPGTLFAETTTREIDSWDVEKAKEMVPNIKERYGATPYGFSFTTRERTESDFDSKETAKSKMFYLGGRIRTLEEVEADNKPDEEILRANMRGNDWDRVIENTNSYKTVQVLYDGDVVLEWDQKGETK